jgi:hypothetical protein
MSELNTEAISSRQRELAVFGASRDQLLAAMERLGWRREGDRWFQPKDADAETAFNQLLQALRPVEGLTPENLQDVMLGQDPR